MSDEALRLIAGVSLILIMIIATVGLSFGIWYDLQNRKRW